MRSFSIRPALTMRGRSFNGVRGWAGKPLHPPLTDIPVGAYVLAAAFDLISAVGHNEDGPETSTGPHPSPSSAGPQCRCSQP
jgi:hypothetical protein